MEEMTLKLKIIKIQNEIRLSKDGKNSFSNYNYFQPDDLLRRLNPLLEKYGIFSKLNLTYHETFYKATLTLEDIKSGEKEEYVFDILKASVKGANEAQNSGATLTYAKRYLLQNAFNIADNRDDFDNISSHSDANQDLLSALDNDLAEIQTYEEFRNEGKRLQEIYLKKGLPIDVIRERLIETMKQFK